MMYRRRKGKRGRSEFKGMTDVSSILKRSFKNLKLDATLWEYKISEVWNEVVGKNIAKRAQPFRVIGTTLYVKVSSAPWMQELNFMKEGIRAKLNKGLEGKKVEEIIFKLGRWDKKITKNRHKKPPWMEVHLGKEDENSIKKEITSVKDVELREIFCRIMTLEKRLKIFKTTPSRQE